MLVPTVPDRTNPARILLVDDNKGGLSARKAILEELGHRVVTAAGGEEALDHFSKGKFDLVVTDHRMGKMSGVELIKKLRGIEPGVSIILLSGFVGALGLTESSTGADMVLAKSANEVSHLIRAVSRLLKPKAARKPAATQKPSATRSRKTS
jgi:CheY-like chemotaxis protein